MAEKSIFVRFAVAALQIERPASLCAAGDVLTVSILFAPHSPFIVASNSTLLVFPDESERAAICPRLVLPVNDAVANLALTVLRLLRDEITSSRPSSLDDIRNIAQAVVSAHNGQLMLEACS